MNKAIDLVNFIAAHRLGITSEEELQRSLSELFERQAIRYDREVRLGPRDRIDFVVGEVGVEIKIEGSIGMVTRQLYRYAQYDRITELVLVTTRTKHSGLPERLAGKPVHVCVLLGSTL